MKIHTPLHPLTLSRAGIALAVFIATATLCSASFVLVENFNSLSTGNINGVNGWTAPDDNYTVIDTAPASPSDQALSNGTDVAYRSTPDIAAGGLGTLYFEVYFNDILAGQSFGLTTSSGTAAADYVSQMSVNVSGDFRIRDGGTTRDVDNVTLAADSWYQFWMTMDNSADTWELYVKGGAISTQTQVTVVGSDSTFDFRTTPPDSISRFLLSRGGSGNGTAVIDNIYLDSSAINLSTPTIPETSHAALLMLIPMLFVGVLIRRKRCQLR